jgi:hypothetical protein
MKRFRLGLDEITVLATSAQTNGDLFAIEVRMPPGGGPPAIHRHSPSEIYYVLEGEFTFYVGDADTTPRPLTAIAGDVVPLPEALRTPSEISPTWMPWRSWYTRRGRSWRASRAP